MRYHPTEHIQSFDGTRLAVYELGEKGRPILVLSNGLGGNLDCWHYVVRHFEDRYRIITWDYRGLYHSESPTNHGAFKMDDHVLDLATVLDHFEVSDAVFLGWSMGVQLNFEFTRYHPNRVRGLIAINGTFGSPFSTALNTRIMEVLAPILLFGLRNLAPALHRGQPVLRQLGKLAPLVKRIGLIGPDVDEDTTRSLIEGVLSLDFAAYSRIFQGLGEHDASDALPGVRMPVLVIAGERDMLTPARCSEAMARQLPEAQLEILPDVSHFAPIEAPKSINRLMDGYLRGLDGMANTET
jgi:pimeloyl-ACP methyl ester carboxylesterase